MLPETGKISLDNVRNELNIKGSISLGQIEVRKLAGQEILPQTPQECDYYFETIEDFASRIKNICQINNYDLSDKTLGFSDSITTLSWDRISDYYFPYELERTPKIIVAKNITGVYNLFAYCELKEITPDLFRYCPNIIDFESCFGNSCYQITNIPKNLFKYNIKAEKFSYCFYVSIEFEDNSLTEVPFELFDNCKNVKYAECCFGNRISVVSKLPDIWNKQKFSNVVDGTEYALNCTKAANYNEIPDNFK